MKAVKTLCDLCGDKAERELDVNGKTVAICSPGCYSLFWSREWEDWRANQYQIFVSYGTPELATEIERKLEIVIKQASGR